MFYKIDPMVIIIYFIIGMLIPMRVSFSIALKKDKEPFVWMFLGLIFGWIAVLIIACISNPRKESSQKIENKNSDLKQLTDLKALLDGNIITQEEFEAKKKQILGL